MNFCTFWIMGTSLSNTTSTSMAMSTNGTCGTSVVLHNDLHLMNLYQPFRKDGHNVVDELSLKVDHLDCSLLDLDFRAVETCLHDRGDVSQLCR